LVDNKTVNANAAVAINVDFSYLLKVKTLKLLIVLLLNE
jgi:hypothetical protein